MKDPKANVIEPVFGADVEKVAQIGPPREPKIPESAGDDVSAKMAGMSV
jgi:hypothetical protein